MQQAIVLRAAASLLQTAKPEKLVIGLNGDKQNFCVTDTVGDLKISIFGLLNQSTLHRPATFSKCQLLHTYFFFESLTSY